jgi:hypothetical protein
VATSDYCCMLLMANYCYDWDCGERNNCYCIGLDVVGTNFNDIVMFCDSRTHQSLMMHDASYFWIPFSQIVLPGSY